MNVLLPVLRAAAAGGFRAVKPTGLLAEAAALLPGAVANRADGDAAASEDAAGVAEPVPDMPCSTELIEINWSSEFSETICVTICVGSTGEVGS